MTSQILIYGGAFNPPTVAHVAILSNLCTLAAHMNAQVWVLPSGQRRDKTIEVTPRRRLEYVRAMIDDAETGGVDVRIEQSELHRTAPTETIDTVRELERAYPSNTFVWVFGVDSVLTMHEWRDGEHILEQLEKILLTRPGYRLAALPPKSRLLRVETPKVSSTLLRQCLREGSPYDHLVTPRVARVIAGTMKT